MITSKTKGEVSEAKILAKLVELGYSVCIPWGDNKRYDFVIESEGTFYTVQCKTGRFRNGVIKFNTCSSVGRMSRTFRHYRGEVDFFAIYCPELNTIYLVSPEVVALREATLRVDPPKKNQTTRILWATDYEVDVRIAQFG